MLVFGREFRLYLWHTHKKWARQASSPFWLSLSADLCADRCWRRFGGFSSFGVLKLSAVPTVSHDKCRWKSVFCIGRINNSDVIGKSRCDYFDIRASAQVNNFCICLKSFQLTYFFVISHDDCDLSVNNCIGN